MTTRSTKVAIAIAAVLLVALAVFFAGRPTDKTAASDTITPTPAAGAAQAPRAETPASDSSPADGKTAVTVEQSSASNYIAVGQLTVTVVRASDRSPVENAKIIFCSVMPFTGQGQGRVILAEATTDEQGRALIAGPGPEADAMQYSLQAVAKDMASMEKFIQSFEPPDHNIEFVLPDSLPVSGRILTAAGEGVAGARIADVLREHPPSQSGERSDGYYRVGTRADENGSFILNGVPVGKQYIATVKCTGYLDTFTPSMSAGDENILVIMQRAEANLHGKVVSHSGVPMPRMMVEIVHEEWMTRFQQLDAAARSTELPPPYAHQTALTDEKGEFRFNDLPAAKFRYSVNFGNNDKEGEVVLASGEDHELVIHLDAFAVVTGKAKVATTGAPLAGVTVSTTSGRLRSRQTIGVYEAITSGDGSYRLEVPPGNVNLYAQAPRGYALLPPKTESRGLNLEPGGTGELDFEFTRGAVLSGRLIDSQSQPIVRETINIRDVAEQRFSFFAMERIVSDRSGAFQATLIPDRTYHVGLTGRAGTAEATVDLPPTGAYVELITKSFGSIEGTVTFDGKPVEGIQLFHAKLSDDGQGRSIRSGDDCKTSAQGNYSLKNVWPGKVEVGIQPGKGLGFVAPQPIMLQLEPGQILREVNFELTKGEYLDGFVLNEEDEPIVKANVSLSATVSLNPGGASFSGVGNAETNSEGYFRIEGFSQDRVLSSLSASHIDYEFESISAPSISDAPFTITLKRKNTLVIQVLKHGAPVTNFRYRLPAVSPGMSSETNNTPWVNIAQGGKIVATVQSNTYLLMVEETSSEDEPTGYRARKLIQIYKDVKPAEEHVNLISVPTVRGRIITRETREPVGEARLTLVTGGPERYYSVPPLFQASSDAEGSFEFQGVEPGSYTIISHEDKARGTHSFDLAEGETPPFIEFEVSSQGVLYVTLLSATGEAINRGPIPYTLTNRRIRGNSFKGTMNETENGLFVLDKIDLGEYDLEITYPPTGERLKRSVRLDTKGYETFVLGGKKSVSGSITLNGQPWNGQPELALGHRSLSERIRIPYVGSNQYAIDLLAGKYQVELVIHIVGGNLAEFEVQPYPPEQVIDINLQTAELDIVVIFPEGERAVPGSIEVQGPNSSSSVHFDPGSSSAFAPHAKPGTYSAFFKSHDGKWYQKSEPVEAKAGETASIIIELRKPTQGIHLANWRSEDFQEAKTVSFDITEHLTAKSNRWQIAVRHEKGEAGLSVLEMWIDHPEPEDRMIGQYRYLASPGKDVLIPFQAWRNSGQQTVRLKLRAAGEGTASGTISLIPVD